MGRRGPGLQRASVRPAPALTLGTVPPPSNSDTSTEVSYSIGIRVIRDLVGVKDAEVAQVVSHDARAVDVDVVISGPTHFVVGLTERPCAEPDDRAVAQESHCRHTPPGVIIRHPEQVRHVNFLSWQ